MTHPHTRLAPPHMTQIYMTYSFMCTYDTYATHYVHTWCMMHTWYTPTHPHPPHITQTDAHQLHIYNRQSYTHTHIHTYTHAIHSCKDAQIHAHAHAQRTHRNISYTHIPMVRTTNTHTIRLHSCNHTQTFSKKYNGNLWSAFLLAPVLRPWAKLKNRTYLPRCQEKAFVGRLEAWNHELKTNEQNWLHYLFSNQLRHSVH